MSILEVNTIYIVETIGPLSAYYDMRHYLEHYPIKVLKNESQLGFTLNLVKDIHSAYIRAEGGMYRGQELLLTYFTVRGTVCLIR